MKRNFLLGMMALLAAAGMSFVSCGDPIEPTPGPDGPDTPVTPKPETPVFPEAIEKALEAGGSHTLELQPNVDWKIELKYETESTGWFWIQDGNSQAYTLRGDAGKKVSVTVCAGDQTDFDTVHSCTLEMTMGDETKTIATFTRGTVERTFSLAYCKVEDNGSDYVYNEDISTGFNYSYNEALTGDSPVVPLVWLERTRSFRRSVLLSANFDWQLKSKPEWLLDLKVTGGAAGEQFEFEFEGDPYAYPLESATAEIVFCAKENRDATYTFSVQIPGCKDMFGISGFTAETRANAAGEIYEQTISGEGAYSDATVGITGSVLGLDDVKIYTFVYFVENQFSTYWDNSAENTSWIKASLAAWETGGPVLQERGLNITVTKNEAAERKACIIAIPASKAPASEYMFFPDGQNLDEQYKQYVVTTLTQAGAESSGAGDEPPAVTVEPITFIFESQYNYPITEDIATLEQVTESNMEALIQKYAKYDKLNISDYFGGTSATYILTYYSTSQSMNQLSIPNFDPTKTLGITCHPANKKEWLSYEESENAFSIWMDKPAETASQNYGIIQLFITATRSYTIICLPEL